MCESGDRDDTSSRGLAAKRFPRHDPPMALVLYEIPISHNCTKVRAVLKRKGLAFESVRIPPTDRARVRDASGQDLVPVLQDGSTVVSDSTRIMLYLESHHPDPPLLPGRAEARAECLLLEDWADQAFMALTRRLAYWQAVRRPGVLERAWGLPEHGLRRRLMGAVGRRIVRQRFGLSARQNAADEAEVRRVAALAVDRLGGRRFLVGESLTLADVTLAAMTAPLWVASPEVRADPRVGILLEWTGSILDADDAALYRRHA